MTPTSQPDSSHEPETPESASIAHYFSPAPVVPSKPDEVTLSLPEFTQVLQTDRGVFSSQRIDTGTKLLLVEMAAGEPPSWGSGDLVDLGCGYGPIAVTLAIRHPHRQIWAVDPNERARSLCVANAEAAGVGDRVRVVSPEEVPSDLVVAGIVSNPPIRIGKAALHSLLIGWLARLAPQGEMWLVVHRNLGADSLASWLTDREHVVTRIASRRGYRLLRVLRAA